MRTYSPGGILNAFAAAPKDFVPQHLVFIVYRVDYHGIIGGMLMKVLVINEALLYSKEELEKYKFSQKCLWGSSIALLIIAAIIYL